MGTCLFPLSHCFLSGLALAAASLYIQTARNLREIDKQIIINVDLDNGIKGILNGKTERTNPNGNPGY